ncbi:MAG: hypothetical protein Q9170_001997 [Blastenia crenularia]
MPGLKSRLSLLGMGQYYPNFLEAGFETWETILDITEDDLDSLGVQRGHRRRLQQEIAFSLTSGAEPDDAQSRALNRSLLNTDASVSTQTGRKRQYTRHPKPDPNAPQRPPSAYLLFSNALRDDLKEHSLSFTDKSKVVGDRWQSMPEAAKNQWRQKASGPWEKYKSDQTQYQGTDGYRGYQAYLAGFNSSQPSKRRKDLSNDSSNVVDGTTSGPRPKRPPSPDAGPSSAARPFKPTRAYPALNPAAPSSSSSPISSRSKKPMSDHESVFSTTALAARDKPAQVFSHACESCRKKKVRCDGVMPTCDRCLRTSTDCNYAGGIRDREKRLVGNLVDKLNIWDEAIRRLRPRLESENRSEVDRLLSMVIHSYVPSDVPSSCLQSPQTSKPGTGFPVHTASQSDESSCGESDVSNVGSMGSTDHINEESFRAETGDGRIDAFLGQTATDNWVDRLQENLNISDRDIPRAKHRSSNISKVEPDLLDGNYLGATAGLKSSSVGGSTFGEHFEPYELPLKASADSFVDAYFTTIHPSFPIISRAEFLRSYEEFFALPRSGDSPGSTFVPMLHLVLAIGAIHAYISQAPWVQDEGLRLLNFARVKATVLETHALQATAYEQVQLCGLGGLYHLVMYEVNK